MGWTRNTRDFGNGTGATVVTEVDSSGNVVAPGVATIADGADVAEGAIADAAVAAGAAGSVSAKLRRLTTDLAALLVQIPATLGQKAKAQSLSVTLASDHDAVGLAAGEAHIGALGGSIVSVSTEFTRPADTTAYIAGDMVSDSTSATTIQTLTNVARTSGGSGYVVGARLSTDKKSITPRFRVHLFNALGATVANDNAAYESLYADIAKRVGYFDLPAMATPADSTNSTESRAIDMTIRIPFVTVASRNLYYVLEVLDAFTPASGEKFTLVLVADLN